MPAMNTTATDNPTKTLWRDAAADGGIIGAILFIVMLLDDFTGHEIAGAIYLIKIVILAGGIYIFARRRSLKYAETGFSIRQAMNYIIAMMVFTGFITGIENYLAVKFISPDFYQASLENAQATAHNIMESMRNWVGESQTGDELINEYERRWLETVNSPITYIISGIVGKVIAGGILGIFISPRIRRLPIKNR